jgi:hypothetical protein
MQLQTLTQVAVLLICGVDVSDLDIAWDSHCNEIFLISLKSSSKILDVTLRWLPLLSPLLSHLPTVIAVAYN